MLYAWEEKLNNFQKTLEKKTVSEWCDKQHILNWLMQKSWTRNFKYVSYPDKEEHTVYDGLNEVFKFMDELYSQVEKNYSAYNSELRRCYKEIENLKKGVDTEATRKLEEIKKILE